jgi:hypothetical protein
MRFVYVSICLIFCCTTNITNYGHEKIEFTISTYPEKGDTTVQVTISMNRILDTIPEIQLNGNPPDTPYYNASSFSFKNIPTDNKFEYQFVYQGDTLSDSVFVPGMIDSLFVNGKYFSNSPYDNSIVVDDSSTEFSIRWVDKHCADNYSVLVYGKFIPDDFSCSTTDTFTRVKMDLKNMNVNGDITTIDIQKFKIRNRSNFSFSDNSSEMMSVNYFIIGPSYRSNLYIIRK